MILVNSIGSLCPAPIIDIAWAITENPQEAEFELSSDDPATWPDLKAWGRMTGHKVIQLEPARFLIQKV